MAGVLQAAGICYILHVQKHKLKISTNEKHAQKGKITRKNISQFGKYVNKISSKTLLPP